MRIPIYQVDAFTSRVFAGNPAAICPLEEWLPDEQMQAIAAENNLAETAFFVPRGDGFDLRWFTPMVEVDLCGHATLASAFVLFEKLAYTGESIAFSTKSGMLTVVRRADGMLEMDFPSRPPAPCSPDPELVPGLDLVPQLVLGNRDYLCVFKNEEDVRALKPDLIRLRNIDRFAVIATARGSDCDFVSRFFAPGQGVDEDPVTGSAHCTLIPYWSEQLGKKELFARQLSKRGGEIYCEDRGLRVGIAGNAVLFLEGTIDV